MLTRIVLLVALMLSPIIAFGATTITKDDIKITFTPSVTVGQYLTGDYYIIAPNGISVTKTEALNGEQLCGAMTDFSNINVQGYCASKTSNRYDSSYDVSRQLPVTLNPGNKLVVTTKYQYEGVSSPTGYLAYSVINQAAVFTVVSSKPPANSFRPGLRDNSNKHYNASNINWNLLKNYPTVGTLPNLNVLEDRFSRIWLDHDRGQTGRQIHPVYNMQDYGGHLVVDVGNAALIVNSDYSQSFKEPYVYGLIQNGIDVYWAVKKNVSIYQMVISHMQGRKFPFLFAAYMLNDADMKSGLTKTGDYVTSNWGTYVGWKFQEDQTTGYVQQEDVNITKNNTSYYKPDHDYETSMIGMPEWFHHAYDARGSDNAAWSVDPYRSYITCEYGQALAVLMMGLKDAWNHDVYFEVLDRFDAIERGQDDPFGYTVPLEFPKGWRGSHSSGWMTTMWANYRQDFGGTNQPPSRSNSGPSGELPEGTTTETLRSDATDPDGVAGCKANANTDEDYDVMSITMNNSSGNTWSVNLTGLIDGGSYRYWIRCEDNTGLSNSTGTQVTFSVAESSAPAVCEAGSFWPCTEEGQTACENAGYDWYLGACRSVPRVGDAGDTQLQTNGSFDSWSVVTDKGSIPDGWDRPHTEGGSTTDVDSSASLYVSGVGWPPEALSQPFGDVGDGKQYRYYINVKGDQGELYTTDQGRIFTYNEGTYTGIVTNSSGDNLFYIQPYRDGASNTTVFDDYVIVQVASSCGTDASFCATEEECLSNWPGNYWNPEAPIRCTSDAPVTGKTGEIYNNAGTGSIGVGTGSIQ